MIAIIRGLAVAIIAVTLAGEAHAACTTTAEAGAVRKAARQEMRCRFKRLKSGPATPCSVSPAPACADTLVADTVALAYGLASATAAAVDPARGQGAAALPAIHRHRQRPLHRRQAALPDPGLTPAEAEAKRAQEARQAAREVRRHRRREQRRRRARGRRRRWQRRSATSGTTSTRPRCATRW